LDGFGVIAHQILAVCVFTVLLLTWS